MGFAQEVKQASKTISDMYILVGDSDKIGDPVFYTDILDLLSVKITDVNKIKKFVKFSYQQRK